MCGIVFLLKKDGETVDRDEVLRGQRAILHRGPDSAFTFAKDNLGLGFNRLSIVDMAGGDQPFWNADQTVMVVCNGEIYNHAALREQLEGRGHRFRSKSDVEVLPFLYEEDPSGFAKRLDGMYAFVIVDFRRKQVVVGRDRVGIKPLVIYEDGGVLGIASEAKALFATGRVPCALSHQSLYDFFCFGYIPGELTAFTGVYNVPPATLLTFDFDGREVKRELYWEPPFPKRHGGLTMPGPYADAVRGALTQSVADQTIGDLPVGAYLSGGIDSTITTLLLKEAIGDQLRSYSITFEQSAFDESEIIEQTVQGAGIDGRFLHAERIAVADLEKSVWSAEQPQFSPMDVPLCHLSGLVRSSGAKVVLCGEGSDELMGGYVCFTFNQINRALSMPWIRPFKGLLMDRALMYYGVSDTDLAHFKAVYGLDTAPIVDVFGTFPSWYPFWRFRQQRQSALFAEPGRDSLGPDSEMARLSQPVKKRYRHVDEFDKSLYIEMKSRLPNYILQRADSNSMLNGVEARVPFLSNRMIDTLCDVPALYKMFGLREKYILRRAFEDTIPPHVAKTRKRGYGSPSQLLWDEPEERTRYLVGREKLQESGLFDVDHVLELQKRAADEGPSREREDARIELTGVLGCQILHERVASGEYGFDHAASLVP